MTLKQAACSFFLAWVISGVPLSAQSVGSWTVASQAANKAPKNSPMALYTQHYFKETGSALGTRLRPQPFNNIIVDSTLAAFKPGEIRIFYRMNADRKLEFLESQAEFKIPKSQLSALQAAMKQVAKKLKPFPPELKADVGESFSDIMVFVFQ